MIEKHMVYSGKYVMHMLLLNYLGGSKIRIRKILEQLKNCIIQQESEGSEGAEGNERDFGKAAVCKPWPFEI